MTVSPRRAQDGQRPSSTGSADRGAGDQASPDLPPTLFRLPNLDTTGPAEQAGEPSNRSASGRCESDGSQSDRWGGPPGQPADLQQSGSPAERHKTPADEPVDAPPDVAPDVAASPRGDAQKTEAAETDQPTDTASNSATNHSPTKTDEALLPAGRNWMERFGSHALVLSMLLIVVIAAMMTGRGSTPPRADDSVANGSDDELNFDVAADIDLPLSENQSGVDTVHPTSANSSTSVAADLYPDTASDLAGLESTVAPQSAGHSESLSTGPAASVASRAGESRWDQPATVGTSSLSPPEAANAYSTTDAAEAFTPTHPEVAAHPDVDTQPDVGRFPNRSGRVDAVQVSNRSNIDGAPYESPGMRQAAESGTTADSPASHNGPQFSNMPFGISLTPYLPSSPDDATADSPSN